MGRFRGMSRDANRFDNYRELRAKFDSVGKCGHEIKTGDLIGWHPKHGAQCSNCWTRWVEENREAGMMEAAYNHLGY